MSVSATILNILLLFFFSTKSCVKLQKFLIWYVRQKKKKNKTIKVMNIRSQHTVSIAIFRNAFIFQQKKMFNKDFEHDWISINILKRNVMLNLNQIAECEYILDVSVYEKSKCFYSKIRTVIFYLRTNISNTSQVCGSYYKYSSKSLHKWLNKKKKFVFVSTVNQKETLI